MPIYRTFQIIEETIVLNLQYRESSILKNFDLFCLFVAENSPNVPKILQKFRKFPENMPKTPKIRRKFLKKKVFFEALISYRIEKKTLISYRYRSESKKSLSPRGALKSPSKVKQSLLSLISSL